MKKKHIAREHLIPKQIKANGLKESQLIIGDEVLKDIIEGYTKEAGVRNLERKFGEICRKSARKILQEKEKQVVITKDNLEDFLGRSRYTYQKVNEKDEVGIVRGLAWTSVGGDTLQIEVNLMPGKGDFLLTGQLGDVMKESAQAGISYIRSVADRYGIKRNFSKSMICIFTYRKELFRKTDRLQVSLWRRRCSPPSPDGLCVQILP